MNRFTIHGARGSMSASGRAHARYGAETTCFSLETPRGLLIVDAGTGILGLADALMRRPSPPDITLLFTHWHLDHVMGLPCFSPIYQRRFRIRILSAAAGQKAERALSRVFGPPLWPVPIAGADAAVTYERLPGSAAAPCALRRYGVRIGWCPVLHPQSCVAYRFDTECGSVVVATDREHGNPEMDRRFFAFAANADVLVADAHYLPSEYPAHRGWGHSTWPEAAKAARAAGVKRLILTHHDRLRTDAQIARIAAAAKRVFPECEAARPGMTIDFQREQHRQRGRIKRQ